MYQKTQSTAQRGINLISTGTTIDVRDTVTDEIALTRRLKAKGKKYRDVFVEKSITRGIPYQIRGMRKKKGWTQKALAEACGKKQSVISQLEDPDYGRVSIQTLLTLASAFDVALVVRFASFAETIKRTANLSIDDVEISGFDDDANIIDTEKLSGRFFVVDMPGVGESNEYKDQKSSEANIFQYGRSAVVLCEQRSSDYVAVGYET